MSSLKSYARLISLTNKRLFSIKNKNNETTYFFCIGETRVKITGGQIVTPI